MTREEAIEYFKRHIDLYCVEGICREAEEMAIKALEQEPCEDAISRQAVLSLLHFRRNDEDKIDGYVKTKDIINLLSVTTQPKTDWITISERLPEDESRVLVTIQTPMRSKVRSGMFENKRFYNDNGDTWKITDKEVKAWMPLPQPYKAESEE